MFLMRFHRLRWPGPGLETLPLVAAPGLRGTQTIKLCYLRSVIGVAAVGRALNPEFAFTIGLGFTFFPAKFAIKK